VGVTASLRAKPSLDIHTNASRAQRLNTRGVHEEGGLANPHNQIGAHFQLSMRVMFSAVWPHVSALVSTSIKVCKIYVAH